MPASAVLSFDGSNMAWQDFVQALRDIKRAHEQGEKEQGEVFARVRPPERCACEARKVVRDLGLADCVELLDRDAHGGAWVRAPRAGPRTRALAWLFRRRPFVPSEVEGA